MEKKDIGKRVDGSLSNDYNASYHLVEYITPDASVFSIDFAKVLNDYRSLALIMVQITVKIILITSLKLISQSGYEKRIIDVLIEVCLKFDTQLTF